MLAILQAVLYQVARAVGHLVCHQMPERSLWIAGAPLPVCARCTGIYGGVLAALLLRGMLRQRWRRSWMLWAIVLVALDWASASLRSASGLGPVAGSHRSVSGMGGGARDRGRHSRVNQRDDGMSKEKSLLPILLGVAALASAMVLGVVYLFSGYLVKQIGQGASTLRHSPKRETNVIETIYRGPMYPNARRVEDSKETVAIDIPVTGNFEVSSQDYITEDGLEEAIFYYRRYFGKNAEERLEPGGARWVEKREDGFGVVVLKETKENLHVRLVLMVEEPK